MGELTKIRDRLRREREVKIWFWDGSREYTGTASSLTPSTVAGFLKVSEGGDKTVIPGPAVIGRLSRQLCDKIVQMKITGQGQEAHVRAKILKIDRCDQNPRRVTLSGEFVEPREQDLAVLSRLAQAIPKV